MAPAIVGRDVARFLVQAEVVLLEGRNLGSEAGDGLIGFLELAFELGVLLLEAIALGSDHREDA